MEEPENIQPRLRQQLLVHVFYLSQLPIWIDYESMFDELQTLIIAAQGPLLNLHTAGIFWSLMT